MTLADILAQNDQASPGAPPGALAKVLSWLAGTRGASADVDPWTGAPAGAPMTGGPEVNAPLSDVREHGDLSKLLGMRSWHEQSPIDIASGFAPNAMAGAIRAYHGSPHNFDKFDMSKIGTGEGAQAYGHGLYFAGNEGTAKVYRDQVRNMPAIDAANARMAEIAREMDPMRKPGTLREFTDPRGNELAAEYDRLMAEKMAPGRMYEVDINADPAHLLDWDKPLSQQGERVQEALAGFGVSGEQTGVNAYNKVAEALAKPRVELPPGWTSVPGGPVSYDAQIHDPARATQALREAGIPGIRYLDQQSRNPGFSSLTPAQLDARINSLMGDIKAGGGDQQKMSAQLAALERERETYRNQTHNYVMFDDKLIDIIRKYGLAGLLSSGAATVGSDP